MMDNTREILLPESGLAEDILARFVEKAQHEVDNTRVISGEDERLAMFHLVTFRLGREEYGVEIERVQEIIRATDLTPVPGAQSHVKGVINLRGKIIPVVDLRKRFALDAIDASADQRIIVVELGEKRIGMLVDNVSQVIKIPSGIVEEIPAEATSVDENYIKGVGKLDSRLVIILDLNRSLLLK